MGFITQLCGRDYQVPERPGPPSVTIVNDDEVKVSWVAPEDGGSDIVEY